MVGANGAGKTTLLKIMAGLARPTVGTVERFCEDGGLGYLGHATFIYPGLTALENLAFWSGMHGNRRTRRRFRSAGPRGTGPLPKNGPGPLARYGAAAEPRPHPPPVAPIALARRTGHRA
ncbi:MAG: ATP-binding cassette domain-containing protein [Bilophila wadsworthia]